MFSFSKLAAALIFSTLVSANPILRRATCKPNFEGNSETIFLPSNIPGEVLEWTPVVGFGEQITLTEQLESSAFATGEFLVQRTGQPTNTYQIKLSADGARQFALTADSGDLLFTTVAGSSIPSQEFDINCASCPETGSGVTTGLVADGCVISNPSTDTCVTGDFDGATLTLEPCGFGNQVYSFISA